MSGLAERDYGQCEGLEIDLVRSRFPSGECPESESDDAVLDRALSSIQDNRSLQLASGHVCKFVGGLGSRVFVGGEAFEELVE